MVISIALLGFGAAGTFMTLFRKRLALIIVIICYLLLMIISGLMMVIAVWLEPGADLPASIRGFFLLDKRQWPSLFINYLLFFFPFFFGALSLGIIFVKYVGEIGQFYFSNSTGSGIGAVLTCRSCRIFFSKMFLPVVMAPIAIAAGLILSNAKNKCALFLWRLVSMTLAVYRIVEPIASC